MQPEDITLAYKNALKPGETFRFRCNQCGKCCRNREDILLNPYDLHRISSVLRVSHQDIVERYCTVYIGDTSRFPCVLLKPVGKEKACPLLKDNRCSVHKGKPTVCALYPLGRAMGYSVAVPSSAPMSPFEPRNGGTSGRGGKAGEPKSGSIFYFLNGATCGSRDEEHTVEEWLGEYDLQESEAWFLEWSKVLGEAAVTLQQLEKQLKPKLMEPIFGAVFTGMYLNYYARSSFMVQFRANAERVSQMLKAIKAEVEKG